MSATFDPVTQRVKDAPAASRLFDPNTGELSEDAPVDKCPECLKTLALKQQAEDDLGASETEVRRLRRIIRALQVEIRQMREDSPEAKVADTIFNYWVARLSKDKRRTKFTEKRQKAVLKVLKEGYEPTFIARAVDGIAVGAFIRSDGFRFDDLELVCRDGSNVERFNRTAELQKAPTLIGPAWEKEFAGPPPEPMDLAPEW